METTEVTMTSEWTWWKHGVIYQIYPRSFQDSNGDGIGDLPGIISRLDYLSDTLGIDAIWLSPFYRSPMADFGYDVSDYCDVDPIFGTLDDADALIAACHERGLKLIVDFVPNHSSDQHPWFIESRSSRDNPKRDWYIWRDPKPDGSEPNNWLANFGGRPWTFDAATGQYYLHLFLPEQPDLNWRNPEVRDAMYGAMRFWLERGVDGFRIDVAHFVIKHPEFADNPPAPPGHISGLQARYPYDTQLHVNDVGRPEVHQVFREMRALVDEYPDRYTVGEITEHDPEKWASYYGDGDELHMPFNFSMMHLEWDAAAFRDSVLTIEEAVPDDAWPNYVLSNHDVVRIASRVGKAARTRVAMMMLLTLRGTPTLYYGEELGMPAVAVPEERQQDPWGIREPGQSRDGCRTPMRWVDSRGTGFCNDDVEPWLPVGPIGEISVAAQLEDPVSILNLTRALLALRREEPLLHAGDLEVLDAPEGCFAYRRTLYGAAMTIALNFTETPLEVAVGEGEVVVATGLIRSPEHVGGVLELGPDEGVIIRH